MNIQLTRPSKTLQVSGFLVRKSSSGFLIIPPDLVYIMDIRRHDTDP